MTEDEFNELQKRVENYFQSQGQEPAGRLLDLLRVLCRVKKLEEENA
jgi:hypothetical protein